MQVKGNRTKLLDTKPRRKFFIQTAFGTSFSYLTSGVFLSGLAIYMGAGDVLVSYLSVIINICGVLILAFTAFLERFKSCKRVVVCITALSKLMTLFIVAVPVIFSPSVRLVAFTTAVIVAFTLQAQATVVMNQWMLGFMDEKSKGRYISLRQMLTLIVTVVLSLSGGYFMDYMQGAYLGFVIMFAVAGGMGAMEVILLLGIPDSIVQRSVEQKRSFASMFKLPFKNKNFLVFVIYVVAFYMLLYISDSFTMVYMQKYLGLPYKTVTGLYMIISLPQILLLGIWGRISDKYGAQFVLKISIWLFAGETLFMFFASPSSWQIFIPIAFFAAAVGNAGFLTASFNRRYELMPENNRIVFDNFYTAAVGIGFILGPMIGGAIKGAIETGPAQELMPFANIRILYLISAAGILILQIIYMFVFARKRECSCCCPCECPTE